MTKLECYSGETVVKAFQKAGWSVSRQKGSHIIMEKPGHETTLAIPHHKGRDVKRGTLRNLIKDAGMNVEEFIKNL
jgi:predicted RNA binding protein YcfA (HicA-like mRNA interferase family)